MIKWKYLPVILLALCCVSWVACTQQRQPCLTPKIASLIMETIHFKSDTSTVFVDTALPSAVFIPLTNVAAYKITYPLASSFTLSLSPDSNACQWRFTTDTLNAVAYYDTLTFYYQRKLQFLSNACGYTDFYSIDSVHTTHNIVDSLHVINTSVTNNVNTKHLQVYIRHDF
jgi:hypothetical protein